MRVKIIQRFAMCLAVTAVLAGFATRRACAAELDPVVAEYVKQIVIHSYLGKISDVTKKIVQQQNINIMPQIAQGAIYQVGFEAYRNSSLGDTIIDAYQAGINVAEKAQETRSFTVEVDIKKAIDAYIDPLVDDPIFRKLIEQVINQSLAQQQRIMAQANAQRMIEEMVVRQQIMQEALKQQFEAAYQKAYEQAYKNAYQQQLNSSGVFSSN